MLYASSASIFENSSRRPFLTQSSSLHPPSFHDHEHLCTVDDSVSDHPPHIEQNCWLLVDDLPLAHAWFGVRNLHSIAFNCAPFAISIVNCLFDLRPTHTHALNPTPKLLKTELNFSRISPITSHLFPFPSVLHILSPVYSITAYHSNYGRVLA